MKNPTFKLDNVIRTGVELEDFEGPLVLILQLLSKNKIEIADIKISQLLDQYLIYLDEMKAMDLDIASEFVAMASHLVFVKTKMLLSTGDEEVAELQELVDSLEILQSRDAYVRIKSAVDNFSELYRKGAGVITKLPEPMKQDGSYRYVHSKSDILTAMLRMFDNGDGKARYMPQRQLALPSRIVYSITEKAGEIISRLRRSSALRIRALFYESRSRTELVATFVALLELCKNGLVHFAGDDEDIVVSYSERKINCDPEASENGYS